ncbi:hypothetical protein C4K68_05470 [Pokkaliibacter plantistimulans]|uniref:Uncharacterized protein n=1 Tax=Proteobacteria bacterium 228 TaxID=2083153 RepID=A0A2S5KW43_9PROT|nr:hypothetical protein [Pokkaliibacter plantistimulans]PPC78496.1 hypothetical protein C4K68_05470 [Pokkaliibacter plantistimulans]
MSASLEISQSLNLFLVAGGILSLVAAMANVAMLVGGPSCYRFFGASQRLVQLAERGHALPTLISAFVALLLMIWAGYAFSAAGMIERLPLMKFGLVLIAVVYIARAVLAMVAWLRSGEKAAIGSYWAPSLCLVFGVSYLVGAVQQWPVL